MTAAQNKIGLVTLIFNNNAYGNASFDLYGNNTSLLLGSRITNAPAAKYGLDANTANFISGYNYFESNAGGIIE